MCIRDRVIIIEPNEITVVSNLGTLDFLQVSCPTFILNRYLELRQQEIKMGALILAVFGEFKHVCASLIVLNYTVYVLLDEHFDCALLENCFNILREVGLDILT